MIRLTRLNNEPMILNSDLIQHIETTPDTAIALINGQRWIVRESAEEVVRRVVAFRRSIYRPPVAPTVISSFPSNHADGEADEL